METTKKFTGKADLYSHYRPAYPEEYIRYLLSYNRLNPDSAIADVGSGTGILTRQLLEKGMKVFAVEPNEDMRHAAEKALSGCPGFTSVSGTAENTGLEENSVDLITVAQAFHWFDRAGFRRECRRVLKQDSHVALVWNSRDGSSRLIIENAEICRKFCPAFKGFSEGIEGTPEVYREFFRDGKYERQVFRNDLEYDLDGFVGRNLSSSYAPKETEPGHADFVRALTELFAKYGRDGRITVPNITRSYIGKV